MAIQRLCGDYGSGSMCVESEVSILNQGDKLWYVDKRNGNIGYVEFERIEDGQIVFLFEGKEKAIITSELGVRLFRERSEALDKKRSMDREREDYQHKPENESPSVIGDVHLNANRIQIGSCVIYRDLESLESFESKIVRNEASETFYNGMGYRRKSYSEVLYTSEANGDVIISDESPLGKELIGKRSGDTVAITVDGYKRQYRIISVRG